MSRFDLAAISRQGDWMYSSEALIFRPARGVDENVTRVGWCVPAVDQVQDFRIAGLTL